MNFNNLNVKEYSGTTSSACRKLNAIEKNKVCFADSDDFAIESIYLFVGAFRDQLAEELIGDDQNVCFVSITIDEKTEETNPLAIGFIRILEEFYQKDFFSIDKITNDLIEKDGCKFIASLAGNEHFKYLYIWFKNNKDHYFIWPDAASYFPDFIKLTESFNFNNLNEAEYSNSLSKLSNAEKAENEVCFKKLFERCLFIKKASWFTPDVENILKKSLELNDFVFQLVLVSDEMSPTPLEKCLKNGFKNLLYKNFSINLDELDNSLVYKLFERKGCKFIITKIKNDGYSYIFFKYNHKFLFKWPNATLYFPEFRVLRESFNFNKLNEAEYSTGMSSAIKNKNSIINVTPVEFLCTDDDAGSDVYLQADFNKFLGLNTIFIPAYSYQTKYLRKAFRKGVSNMLNNSTKVSSFYGKYSKYICIEKEEYKAIVKMSISSEDKTYIPQGFFIAKEGLNDIQVNRYTVELCNLYWPNFNVYFKDFVKELELWKCNKDETLELIENWKSPNSDVAEYETSSAFGDQIAYKHIIKPATKEELQEIIKQSFDKGKYNLNFIDTSEITDMGELFSWIEHDFDVSGWDVSNVVDMHSMFEGSNLNCDLSKWDVSNVVDMRWMFEWCIYFEGKGLENWDVTNAKYKWNMFKHSKVALDKKYPSWFNIYESASNFNLYDIEYSNTSAQVVQRKFDEINNRPVLYKIKNLQLFGIVNTKIDISILSFFDSNNIITNTPNCTFIPETNDFSKSENNKILKAFEKVAHKNIFNMHKGSGKGLSERDMSWKFYSDNENKFVFGTLTNKDKIISVMLPYIKKTENNMPENSIIFETIHKYEHIFDECFSNTVIEKI